MSTLSEAARRRTFAVIAHPDAGKSTLTEALALHAHVISEAGAVHGKGNRKATVSDWMEMEKDRGISIASSALQFEYLPENSTAPEPYVINLVDTPGHADFSEDTYRVLSAVDAAVMLIDAAKGLEVQTMKLFEVCRHRRIPIITVMGMQIAMMLGGAVLTETTFEWNGLGYMLAEYMKARDYVAVQGIVMMLAVIVAISNFVVDVIAALIDPRVRY